MLTMTSATAPSLEDCSSLDQTIPFFGLAVYQPGTSTKIEAHTSNEHLGLRVGHLV